MIEMFVTGVAIDIRTNIPLVILNDSERKFTLPIWIGAAEAQAIARGLTEEEMDRPMTHDLLASMVDALDATIDCIEINSYEESTFYASIILMDKDEKSMAIDSRPSDAIALALRLESPIFVSEQILDQVGGRLHILEDNNDQIQAITDPEEAKQFKEFLRNVKASDFSLDRSQGQDDL
jgi:uncharacterized protein